jgi:hypothetical protein
MHAFDPNGKAICARLERDLGGMSITAHVDLPDALADLPELMPCEQCLPSL